MEPRLRLHPGRVEAEGPRKGAEQLARFRSLGIEEYIDQRAARPVVATDVGGGEQPDQAVAVASLRIQLRIRRASPLLLCTSPELAGPGLCTCKRL